jgi:hypothetical protein
MTTFHIIVSVAFTQEHKGLMFLGGKGTIASTERGGSHGDKPRAHKQAHWSNHT